MKNLWRNARLTVYQWFYDRCLAEGDRDGLYFWQRKLERLL